MNRMTTTVFGLALIVLLCGAASAAQINVNQTGWWNETGDMTFHAINPGQIRAAVDNAIAGDTIYVYNGSYNESVKVDNQLTLAGEGADVVTVTAAELGGGVFYVTADYVNITGFTVTGGYAGVYLQDADHCNISDNIASGNNIGIFLWDSCDNNTLTENNCSGNHAGIHLWDSCDNNTLTENICSGNTERGIHLHDSCDNNTLTGNNCSGNYYGIWLSYWCDNNTLTGNNCSGNTPDGICLSNSGNNTLTGNNCSGNSFGIHLYNSNDNNTLTGNDCSGNTEWGICLVGSSDNNTLTGNDCSGNLVGIELYHVCDNNTLTGNDCSYSGIWGFYSDETSHNNVVEDLTVASYPTTISFTYGNGIAITGVETAPPDPAGKTNITRYVNATDVTANSWLFLNVSYDNSDIAGLDESSLRMWRHDGAWSEVAESGVNVTGNYVYANITEFSVFAPMGDPGATPYNPLGISKTDDVSGCADVGDTITYEICYENPNTRSVHNVTITDALPAGVTFDSASGGVPCVDGVVTWTIDNLAAGATGCVTLNVTVNTGTEGQTLENCARIESDETKPAEACVDTVVCVCCPPVPVGPDTVTDVPVLTPPGMALMIGLLAVVGSVMLRRRE